jgi:hypothetical protein
MGAPLFDPARIRGQMFRLDVQPAAGELAYYDAWQAAPDVTVAVSGVRIDAYETATVAMRPRLALAVEARNGSAEPFALVNEFGLFDDAGKFRRHVWVDPATRPLALSGVRVLAPGEALSAEVFVSLERTDDASRTYIPSFGGLVEHSCQGCGHDEHSEFLPRAMCQPVVIRRDATASDA